MKGSIHSRERCPECGRKLQDNRRNAVSCPDHPDVTAHRLEIRFPGVNRRFLSYDEAHRFLTGLRFKSDEGIFDPRDYRKDNPLSFSRLAQQWLVVKKAEVKPGTYKSLRPHMDRACAFFGDRNIRTIGYGELEQFKISLIDISSKTRFNLFVSLHSFFKWLKDCEARSPVPFEMPKFPDVKFELGYRNLTDKATQQRILDEVRKISYGINPKIWLGIKWLTTYFSIRPEEMIRIKEKEINLQTGHILIPHPKEKRYKAVPLLEEDMALAAAHLRPATRELPFFRHVGGRKGVIAGEAFGEKAFYKWWVKACENLGVKDLDLYGGTKHTSVTALAEYHSPEEIRMGAKISTNKAFERYLQIDERKTVELYRRASARVLPMRKAKEGPNDFGPSEERKYSNKHDFLVEAAGVEPASGNLQLQLLHA